MRRTGRAYADEVVVLAAQATRVPDGVHAVQLAQADGLRVDRPQLPLAHLDAVPTGTVGLLALLE